ncbi:hypothetical protein, variant [Fonticula alba]|nr:hypothetical protein, variant [Fonticula alba]KCV68411.1 hypothetical protein, variant [Fonticula alba]|eukprot:XP_009496843.1 hypothetical protein, variant [Fonticula alba]
MDGWGPVSNVPTRFSVGADNPPAVIGSFDDFGDDAADFGGQLTGDVFPSPSSSSVSSVLSPDLAGLRSSVGPDDDFAGHDEDEWTISPALAEALDLQDQITPASSAPRSSDSKPGSSPSSSQASSPLLTTRSTTPPKADALNASLKKDGPLPADAPPATGMPPAPSSGSSTSRPTAGPVDVHTGLPRGRAGATPNAASLAARPGIGKRRLSLVGDEAKEDTRSVRSRSSASLAAGAGASPPSPTGSPTARSAATYPPCPWPNWLSLRST